MIVLAALTVIILCSTVQFKNGIQVTVNGLTGDLLASVTDTAVQAGGDDVSIDSINVCELPALTDKKNKKPQRQNRASYPKL